jgi:hypothetical protein
MTRTAAHAADAKAAPLSLAKASSFYGGAGIVAIDEYAWSLGECRRERGVVVVYEPVSQSVALPVDAVDEAILFEHCTAVLGERCHLYQQAEVGHGGRYGVRRAVARREYGRGEARRVCK